VSGEDAIDLEKPAGARIAEGWFEVPKVEAPCLHSGRHLRKKLFALIEGKEGHLKLHGRCLSERMSGPAENLGLVALDVELEEDFAGLSVLGEYIVEATHRDHLSLDVLRFRSGGEVGVQHGEDGAGERVGGDVDLDFAGDGTQSHAIRDGPERIGDSSFEKLSMCCTGGFKREDASLIAVSAAERRELPRVGTHVDEEVDSQKREKFAIPQLLRAVDARLPDLVTGRFYCGAD